MVDIEKKKKLNIGKSKNDTKEKIIDLVRHIQGDQLYMNFKYQN